MAGQPRKRSRRPADMLAAVRPTESQEQAAFFDFARPYLRSKGIPESLCYAVPNGAFLAGDAKQRAIQMARLKREGLTAGVCDINFDWPKRAAVKYPKPTDPALERAAWLQSQPFTAFLGLRIEMKRRPNKLSPEQEAHILALRQAGFNCIVAYSADEAIWALKGYLGDASR